MDKETRKEILEEWDVLNLPVEKRVTKLFEKVRDIKFGRMGSRDPKDVYERKKGTCSGKTFLLKELYTEIGVKTEDMIALQRWKDLTWFPDSTYDVVDFPDECTEIIERTDVVDFHNYLQILVDGKWITVDVTIDKPLRKIGFYTTLDWDGKSDMPLCFAGTHKVWDCGDKGLEKKKELISKLPQKIQDDRNLFLERMTSWIDSLRESGKV